MPFRYMLKQLFMPPGGLLLLLLAAWWLRRRFPRLAAGCFGLGIAGLWLMSLPMPPLKRPGRRKFRGWRRPRRGR